MNAIAEYLLVAVLAYLLGATPTAYLVVKLLSGRDIRRLGSGNVGVMNTVRQLGLPAGMLVFIGEGAKGAGAIALAHIIVPTPEAKAVAGVMALIGVNWSVFVGFAGGRGTTVSVFITLVVLWQVLVVMAVIWLTIVRLKHDNFIATRANILALPFVTAALVLALDKPWAYVWLAVGGSIVLLVRHRRETDDHYIAASSHASVE